MSPTQTLSEVNTKPASESIELRPIQNNALEEVQSPTVVAGEETTEPDYPKGSKFFLIFFALMLTLLLAGLDVNILSTAIPRITDEFHTIADVGWYLTAYRLSSSSLQFAFGKLYKQYSTKWLLVGSIAVFLFGSILCAAAVSSRMFVVGRAVTGVGVAGGSAGFFNILSELVPLRERPLYGSIFGAVEGVSGLAAPPLGGLITEKLSWRWCFWINLPIGGAALLAMALLLPSSKPRAETERLGWKKTLQQLDIIGSLFFIPSLAALFIAFNWAGFKYSWSDGRIIGLFVVFGVLLVAFVLDQALKGDAAILPLRLLKNKSVVAGVIISTCIGSALTLWEYYAPTYFQVVLGYSPARSGYTLLPCLIATLVGILLQGSGTSYFGYYAPFIIVSSIMLSIGAGLMTTWSPSTKLPEVIGYFIFVGFATGIGFMVPQNSMQTALPKEDQPLGLAIVLFAQNFGPALFVSIAQAIFTARLSENLHKLVPKASVANIEDLGFADIRGEFGAAKLEHVLLGFSKSIAQTWYLALALACCSIVGAVLTDWKSVKEKVD